MLTTWSVPYNNMLLRWSVTTRGSLAEPRKKGTPEKPHTEKARKPTKNDPTGTQEPLRESSAAQSTMYLDTVVALRTSSAAKICSMRACPICSTRSVTCKRTTRNSSAELRKPVLLSNQGTTKQNNRLPLNSVRGPRHLPPKNTKTRKEQASGRSQRPNTNAGTLYPAATMMLLG